MLHQVLAKDGNARWIKRRGATAQGISRIDDAAVVRPPKGMEHGYVPIALYEGMDKPAGCERFPTPAPSPQPPPAPAPRCPKPPVAATCNGKCLQAGHCCVGSNSNDGLPSCQMGCIVANFTVDVAACQAVCRAHSPNCSWSIGGVQMTSCLRNCAPGCDSGDGPYECEAGCQFAFLLNASS